MTKQIILCLMLAACAAGLHASALSNLAASMQPKTWATLSTQGLSAALGGYSGCATSPLEYADNAVWDPVHKKLYFLGAPHYCWPWKFLIYDEATNQWSTGLLPASGMNSGGSQIGHAYDHNAVDPATGDVFHKPYNDRNIYRYSNGSWSLYTTFNATISPSINITGGLSWFPEMGGLVFIQGGGTAVSAAFYKASTQQWSRLATNLSMGNYQEMIAYDPVHKVVLFGGGGGSSDWYAVDAGGIVTKKKNAPASFDVNGDILKPDPVTGKIFLFPYGGSSAYEYDYPTDTWSAFSGTAPPFTPGISISAPVGDYGVIMFVTNSSVYLYKHAAGSVVEAGIPAGHGSPRLSISPNPVSAITRVRITFPEEFGASSSLRIYDLKGRLISDLSGVRESRRSVTWNATGVPSGIYLVRCSQGGRAVEQRVTLMK